MKKAGSWLDVCVVACDFHDFLSGCDVTTPSQTGVSIFS